MAQHGFHRRHVGGILAKGMILRNRFWLRIKNKFVRVPAARFTVQCRAPLPEDFLQSCLRIIGKLVNVFNTQRAQRAFGYFADARNFRAPATAQESAVLVPRRPTATRAALPARWQPLPPVAWTPVPPSMAARSSL